MKKLVALSGAGISAESGLKTFRDHDGLWEGHDVMEVASPIGWARNPELVLEFYNARRRNLLEATFNKAHKLLADIQNDFDVHVITQNVDDLHERAGSTQVLHLHGELFKVRSTVNENHVYDWKKDLVLGDTCEQGYQLRPHIVWFGEEVPKLPESAEIINTADIVVIIGTSLQVYPAASLIAYAPAHAEVYYIDPKPFISSELMMRKHQIIQEKATRGMEILLDKFSGS